MRKLRKFLQKGGIYFGDHEYCIEKLYTFYWVLNLLLNFANLAAVVLDIVDS